MKLTKENVYVKVTTLEESQELLKVLTESGEDVFRETKIGLKCFNDEQRYYCNIVYNGVDWCGKSGIVECKTQVTIKQLKEILQPTTLESVLAELESLKVKIEGLIKQQAESDKKEIQLNKWYKSNVGTITFVTDNKTYYGFDWAGNWSNDVIEKKSFKNHFNLGKWDLMNDREIEQVLINEAKRRYKVGNLISCNSGEDMLLQGLDFILHEDGTLSTCSSVGVQVVFKNGIWAEVIETPMNNGLQHDIEVLKEKHKDFKITVIVE